MYGDITQRSVVRLPYIHYRSGRKVTSLTSLTSPQHRIIACEFKQSTSSRLISLSSFFPQSSHVARSFLTPRSPPQHLCCPPSWPRHDLPLRLTIWFSRHRHHTKASVKDVQTMRCRSWPQEHKSRLWFPSFPGSYQSTKIRSSRYLNVKSSLFAADLRPLRTAM